MEFETKLFTFINKFIIKLHQVIIGSLDYLRYTIISVYIPFEDALVGQRANSCKEFINL